MLAGRDEPILELDPVGFSYWLQGAIEIGGLSSFTPEQAKMVYRTLANCSSHNLFTLQALLLIQYMPPHVAFTHINRELQNSFIHDIDNSYEGDQEFFNLVHKGEKQVISS